MPADTPLDPVQLSTPDLVQLYIDIQKLRLLEGIWSSMPSPAPLQQSARAQAIRAELEARGVL